MNYELYETTLNQYLRRLEKENLLCVLLAGSLLKKKLHRNSDIDVLLIVNKAPVNIRHAVEKVNCIRVCQYWFTEEALLKKLFQEKLEIITKILTEVHPVYLNHDFEETLQLIEKCAKHVLSKMIKKKIQDDFDTIQSMHECLERNPDLNHYERQILRMELILKMTGYHHDFIFNTIEKQTSHLKKLKEKDSEFVKLISHYYNSTGQIQDNLIKKIVDYLTSKWKQKK